MTISFSSSSRLAAGLLCLACLASAGSAAACERRYPESNKDDRTRHVALSARWPDAQILQNLRLQIDRAEVKQAEGKDTLKTEYGYFGRTVTITRSAKDGVEVQLLEKGRDKLVWKLGSC
ncbi:hypothetical protein [Massilia sp. HP4]|uniref:hypothetical protein n=1 Tax=Massilia sp. HP4 TaxID=2562316 RepID=UPI0010C112E6|nr:hypothetical protein [Massilia sp. HP4]